MKREKGYMSLATFKRIIDLNPELERIYLTNWGDPLIHPEMAEMIRYTHSKDKHTAITTNGTALDRELSRELIKSGLDLIKISVDGDKETYQKIRDYSYEKPDFPWMPRTLPYGFGFLSKFSFPYRCIYLLNARLSGAACLRSSSQCYKNPS
jgi:sulfatase maturation enzyme AslB (radical SAM superfamily)